MSHLNVYLDVEIGNVL